VITGLCGDTDNEHSSRSFQCKEEKPNTKAIVYFVISPLKGPAYHICGDDELQAVGGVHAFERHLDNQSYWFARMGQISLKRDLNGVTFQDSDLAKPPGPSEGARQTGRLNPAENQCNAVSIFGDWAVRT